MEYFSAPAQLVEAEQAAVPHRGSGFALINNGNFPSPHALPLHGERAEVACANALATVGEGRPHKNRRSCHRRHQDATGETAKGQPIRVLTKRWNKHNRAMNAAVMARLRVAWAAAGK
jgi:hypothetical protein